MFFYDYVLGCYDHILSFVMAGGQGARLKVLTKDTCKPMVDILGHNRIFDFVATNIANTGIPVTLVAMQYEQRSLAEYVGSGEQWGFGGVDKKLEIVHPNSADPAVRFEGTADSVRKSADRIDKYNPDTILVLGADHVYNMTYGGFIEQHNKSNADITIMANAVPESKVKDFGIVKIDKSGRIIDFAEKPTDKGVIESFRLTPEIKEHLGIHDPNLSFLASMGNYAFFWDRLKRLLASSGVDFGKDIIPAIKDGGGALYAYVFDGYWRDVGRIQDYFDCNMDFTNGSSPINLSKCRMQTFGNLCMQIPADPPVQHTLFNSCNLVHQGSVVTDSVLGHQVVVEEECTLDHCVVLGAEKNEAHSNRIREKEHITRIGKGSKLSHVIIDKNVWIGDGVDVGPHNGTPEEREKILRRVGLRPYEKLADGTAKGDFYIEPETGILVIGRQNGSATGRRVLPNGLRC
ncbi:glucose-1-phosphate adenylyltransferase family protein [Candidatus Poribacteria bacterium]